MDQGKEFQRDILAMTTDMVAAHLSNNSVDLKDIPGLIEKVYHALTEVGTRGSGGARPDPAVPVDKSVTPDHIICLEDGKKLKMLKRHLMTAFQMTPEQYRDRWGLPADYPMVAPNYSKKRSRLAKASGLGTKGRPPVKKTRGRKAKGRKARS